MPPMMESGPPAVEWQLSQDTRPVVQLVLCLWQLEQVPTLLVPAARFRKPSAWDAAVFEVWQLEQELVEVPLKPGP